MSLNTLWFAKQNTTDFSSVVFCRKAAYSVVIILPLILQTFGYSFFVFLSLSRRTTDVCNANSGSEPEAYASGFLLALNVEIDPPMTYT